MVQPRPTLAIYYYMVKGRLEIDQFSGSTYLLEADWATRSTSIWAYISSVHVHSGFQSRSVIRRQINSLMLLTDSQLMISNYTKQYCAKWYRNHLKLVFEQTLTRCLPRKVFWSEILNQDRSLSRIPVLGRSKAATMSPGLVFTVRTIGSEADLTTLPAFNVPEMVRITTLKHLK